MKPTNQIQRKKCTAKHPSAYYSQTAIKQPIHVSLPKLSVASKVDDCVCFIVSQIQLFGAKNGQLFRESAKRRVHGLFTKTKLNHEICYNLIQNGQNFTFFGSH